MEAPYTPKGYDNDLTKINWISGISFILLHLACILVFWAGFSWAALIALVVSYTIRMFGITAGFHRYFTHQSFKTSRLFQFILAWLGTASVQKGPLWWAAHHRHHHKYSDAKKDASSPPRRSFWWPHVGWILSDQFKGTNYQMVEDLSTYPELKFMNTFHLIPPIQLAVGSFVFGKLLNIYFPSLGTSGFQMLVYGFIISTVLLYHSTFTMNSLTQVFGNKRFRTNDDRRNNRFISLITLSEDFHRWKFNISHYILVLLSRFRIVWDLRVPPEHVYAESKVFKRPPREIPDPRDR